MGKTKRVFVCFHVSVCFVDDILFIKSEFSVFMYIYFKNFVWLFLVSAYISQGRFGGKINLKGNLSFIKFYLNLTYEQRNSLISQNFRWEPRLVIMPSYHMATLLLWIHVPVSHKLKKVIWTWILITVQ